MSRAKITKKVVEILNTNLEGSTYTSNVHANSVNKLIFWDEVNNYPLISVVAGTETREYLPANFKWGYLTVSIKIYVEEQNSVDVLEQYFEDIEALLDLNNNMVYEAETGKTTEVISILSIDTDGGLLAPLAVGELIMQIQYDR